MTRQVRKLAGAMLVVAVGTAGFWVTPAAASTSSMTLSVEPTSGPVGSVVTVRTSAACGGGEVVFGPVHAIGDGNALDYPGANHGATVVQFVIPEFVGVPAQPVVSGLYVFGVTCWTAGSSAFTNVVAPFMVTATALPPTRFVGMASTPDGGGYWLAQRDGGVYSYGDAGFSGSLPGLGAVPAAPIAGIAATSDGRGYWLVGADGGVFAFGDATYHGSLPGMGVKPIDPIVGMAASGDSRGYWLIGADGGVFAFGDAPYCPPQRFLGAAPFITPGTLSAPVLSVGIATYSGSAGYAVTNGSGYGMVTPLSGFPCPMGSGAVQTGTFYLPPIAGLISGIAVSPQGGHLWLVGSDGGVFAPDVDPVEVGSTVAAAPFYGSLPSMGISPDAPIVGIMAAPDGGGYWLLGTDGGVFAFGDAAFHGSAA